jgi:NAD+ kinase
MDRFLIVTNDGKDTDYSVTNRVKAQLEQAGKTCFLCEKDEEKKIIPQSVPEDVECALVIGGDGSLIEVARYLWDRDIPILGINMGTLGYLTEVELNNLEDSIGQVIREEFIYEDRMMLEGTFGNGAIDVALNDIVISRNGGLFVTRFRLYVNGELLNSYEADGVIISTPTGSTAYNLSAGGPIVEPVAQLIVVTPICSHALNTSSIVLSPEDEIEIEIAESRNGGEQEVLLSFDGADMVTLKTNDRVTVRRAKTGTKLIRLDKISFLEMLRRKMKGN